MTLKQTLMLSMTTFLLALPAVPAEPIALPTVGAFFLDGAEVQTFDLTVVDGVIKALILVPCTPGNQGEITGLEYRVYGVNGVWWDTQGNIWTGVDVWRAHVDRYNFQVGSTCILGVWAYTDHVRYYEYNITGGAVSIGILFQNEATALPNVLKFEAN